MAAGLKATRSPASRTVFMTSLRSSAARGVSGSRKGPAGKPSSLSTDLMGIGLLAVVMTALIRGNSRW